MNIQIATQSLKRMKDKPRDDGPLFGGALVDNRAQAAPAKSAEAIAREVFEKQIPVNRMEERVREAIKERVRDKPRDDGPFA